MNTGPTDSSEDILSKLVSVTNGTPDIKVYADYIYLDTTERRKFAQNAHEYLITQHQQVSQTVDPSLSNLEINLNFNHPVKYLTWQVANLSYFSYDGTNGSSNGAFYDASTPYDTAKIILNGTDRFAEQKQTYFNSHQVYRHWPTSDWWHTNSAISDKTKSDGLLPSPLRYTPLPSAPPSTSHPVLATSPVSTTPSFSLLVFSSLLPPTTDEGPVVTTFV